MAWIIPLIGVGIQAVSAISQANANGAAGEQNAQTAKMNAGLAIQQAAEDERMYRVNASRNLGSMRAQLGARGLATEGSSAEDVLAEGAASAEYGALKIRYGGQMKSLGFNYNASLDMNRASSYYGAGYFSAAGSLLKGGAAAYSSIDGVAPSSSNSTTGGTGGQVVATAPFGAGDSY